MLSNRTQLATTTLVVHLSEINVSHLDSQIENDSCRRQDERSAQVEVAVPAESASAHSGKHGDGETSLAWRNAQEVELGHRVRVVAAAGFDGPVVEEYSFAGEGRGDSLLVAEESVADLAGHVAVIGQHVELRGHVD
jgi:hypothetical protein